MDDFSLVKERVSVVDYASYLGFSPKRVGNKYYTLKEHDSVRINTNNNTWKQYSTGKFGSVIDFGVVFGGKSTAESLNTLKELAGISKDGVIKDIYKDKEPVKKEKEEEIIFKLPKKDNTYKNVFAYLIKSRGIDKDIVSEFIANKMLYQDTRKNCVFVSPNIENAKFASIRGTNTKTRFTGDISGSCYKEMFFVDRNSDKLVICESVIDAMSRMSINKMRGIENKEDYLVLAGAWKYEEALDYRLNNKEYKEIRISLDSDNAGIKGSDKIYELLDEKGYKGIKKIERLKSKDWNEALIKLIEKEKEIKNKDLEKEKNIDIEK